MKQQTEKRPLLADALPSFAAELRELLEKDEPELAAQVPGLTILDRCRCKDDFCGSFYTRPKPNGSFGTDHRSVALVPEQGTIILAQLPQFGE